MSDRGKSIRDCLREAIADGLSVDEAISYVHRVLLNPRISNRRMRLLYGELKGEVSHE